MVQLLTVTCRSLVLSNKGKGMQSSSEQPLVGEERYVTTRITAAKETTSFEVISIYHQSLSELRVLLIWFTLPRGF